MDFSSFRDFLTGQLPLVIVFAGSFFLLKHFKDQSWIKFISIVLMITIVVALLKGADFTPVIRAILGFFGIRI